MAKRKTARVARKKASKAKKAPKAKKVAKKKTAKPTKRDKAVAAARNQFHEGLYDLIMSAPTLASANKIIEEEVKEARRTMLEEWYRDNPDDLLEDSDLAIDIEDTDDVENQSADYVGSLSDEEVDERLSDGII